VRSRRGYDSLDDIYFHRFDHRKARRKRLPGIETATIEEKPEPPLVYQPERLEMLRATNLTEVEPAGELPAAIYRELNSKKSAIRVTADERQALAGFYSENGFRPLWVSRQGLGERGQSVLRLFQASAEDGMTPEDYIPPSLALVDDDLTLTDKQMRLLPASTLSFRRAPFAMHDTHREAVSFLTNSPNTTTSRRNQSI